MYREFFAQMTATDLPLAAMAFFLVAFVAVVVHTLLRRRRDDDRISTLPLADDASIDPHEVKP